MGHSTDTLTQLKVLRIPGTGLADALDYFITAKEAERCTARTIETHKWGLTRFIAWLEEHDVIGAEGITAYHIRKFFADQDKAGYSASSVHIFAREVKAWVRFLHSEDLKPSNPMAKVAMPRLDKEILPAFTPNDVKKLLAASIGPRDTALVLFLLDTGVRASELCALTIDVVTMATGGVRVRMGKGRKDRLVFMGARCKLVLRKYLMTRRDARRRSLFFRLCKPVRRYSGAACCCGWGG